MAIHSNLKVVVGLGKTGVSCVRYLLQQGFDVIAVDSRIDPPGAKEVRQKFPEVKIYLGSFYPEILTQAEEIVVSPGVSVTEPAIAACITKGISVVGDIELFARAVTVPVIAITGANGKSTVTSLVGMMAEASGKKVKVGGNLGVPALDLLDQAAELYVLELSSFQLETTYSLKPQVAVMLNISPDHMDRYRDFNEYLAAKQRIYLGCRSAVINRDDAMTYTNVSLPATVIGFGIGLPKEDDFGISDGVLLWGKEKLLNVNELKVKGLHNVANVLAALAVGTMIGLSQQLVVRVIRDFSGLPHRCQWVANINNVDWYNDSKGTNVGATKAAIEGLGECNSGKLVLLAGGVGKGADFTSLREVVSKYVRAIVLFGKDAKIIGQALSGSSKILYANSLAEAVTACARLALSRDRVLFSPACASFDMFKNFEHRGDVFMEEVGKIKA